MSSRAAILSPAAPADGGPLVLCHGLVASDFLVRVPFPVPRDRKVIVDHVERQGGGPAANAAVALARLGVRAAFAGAVGDDALGHEQRSDLARENVDVDAVGTIAGVPSFVSFILVDSSDGARTIYSAAAGRPLLPVSAPPLPSPLPQLLLVDGWGGPHQPLAAAAARAAGVPVLLDAGSLRDDTRALLPLADVVIASEVFAAAWAGKGRETDAVRALLEGGAALAAITRGERGAVAGAAGEDDLFEVPAVAVDAVDTTGAGDAFHGAAAAGLVWGWTWEESLRLAAWAAARKCTAPGARSGLPRRSELPPRSAFGPDGRPDPARP